MLTIYSSRLSILTPPKGTKYKAIVLNWDPAYPDVNLQIDRPLMQNLSYDIMSMSTSTSH